MEKKEEKKPRAFNFEGLWYRVYIKENGTKNILMSDDKKGLEHLSFKENNHDSNAFHFHLWESNGKYFLNGKRKTSINKLNTNYDSFFGNITKLLDESGDFTIQSQHIFDTSKTDNGTEPENQQLPDTMNESMRELFTKFFGPEEMERDINKLTKEIDTNKLTKVTKEDLNILRQELGKSSYVSRLAPASEFGENVQVYLNELIKQANETSDNWLDLIKAKFYNEFIEGEFLNKTPHLIRDLDEAYTNIERFKTKVREIRNKSRSVNRNQNQNDDLSRGNSEFNQSFE